MPENTTDAAGRAKEAAGSLTGDKGLKHEGQADQAGEKVKTGLDKAVDMARNLLGKKK